MKCVLYQSVLVCDFNIVKKMKSGMVAVTFQFQDHSF